MKKIILIEKDRQTEKLVKLLLSEKFEIKTVSDFSKAYTAITTNIPDIVIIDPLFPSREGIKLIRNLREISNLPIIAISFNGTERAAAEIIGAGADDFIRKPFFSEEFVARIDRCVRQIKLLEIAGGMYGEDDLDNGDICVDFKNQTVIVKNKKIRFTKSEFSIFALLCKNIGKVLTYDYIIKSVWGPVGKGNTGTLRVNITNIRKKIEIDPANPKYIQTENGIGYRLETGQS